MRIRTLCAAFVLCLSATALNAELTPEQQKTAADLIGKFSANEFRVRQDAVDRLVEMGPDVLPIVTEALAKAKDEEVKLRCEMTLSGIQKTHGVTLESLKADKELKLPSSRVTLEMKDATVDEVLAALAKASGNQPIVLQPADLGKKRISVSVKDQPYWEAVTAICEQAGLWYQPQAWREVALFESESVERAFAYAGPAFVQATQCQRSQNLNRNHLYVLQKGQNQPQENNNRWINLNMMCMVEDRLPLLSCQGVVNSVMGPAGVELLPPQQQRGMMINRMGFSPFGRANVTQINANMADSLPDVPTTVRVSGVVSVELGIGERMTRFDKIFDKGEEKTQGPEGLKLTLKEVKRDGDKIIVTLAVKGDGNNPVMHRGQDDPKHGFAVIAPDGTAHRGLNRFQFNSSGNSGSHISGGNNLTIQSLGVTYNPQTGQPEPLTTGTLTLTFGEAPEAAGDWALTYTGPERVERREYPFTLPEVPIP